MVVKKKIKKLDSPHLKPRSNRVIDLSNQEVNSNPNVERVNR